MCLDTRKNPNIQNLDFSFVILLQNLLYLDVSYFGFQYNFFRSFILNFPVRK